MSLFSKLFKMFLAIVFMPVIPMLALMFYYQIHLKNNILETHVNLAEMVASSMNQHIEDLAWRLSFSQTVADTLTDKKNPTQLLHEALVANPDFVMLAVISKDGKELYRVGEPQVLRELPALDLSQDPSLEQIQQDKRLSVSSFDVVQGRPISEFLYPLSDGDFLYGIMSFFSFLARVQEQRIGHTGRIYIVDESGQIYAEEHQFKPAFNQEQLKHSLASKSRLIKNLSAASGTYVGAYAPTPILGAYVAVLQLKSEAYRNIYYTNIILILFVLTIALLAYFGALTFAEQLGKPIGALSAAAREISQGNLDTSVAPDIGWGEFKQLIADFNQMTADLKAYQELRLQAQVSELKENVFRAVAHDLRAPLLGLQGYLYILQSGKCSEEEKQEYLRLMSQAAKDLSSLLEDVLDVSRVEAGIFAPVKTQLNTKDLLQEVVSTLLPTAQEKGLSLDFSAKTDTLYADAKLLKRVLMNLVSNAIKFTEKGFVRVEAFAQDDHFVIAVQDSGIGLSAQEIKGLFQKFHQVHADKPGYGLGLFISRQIVAAHGGSLEVESESGKGSTFSVRLPKEHV